MTQPEIEIKFTVPLAEIPEEHRIEAERKAREAFVMALLQKGDVSAGRAAELLSINRWQLANLMFNHGISPFDDTMTIKELESEVASHPTETV